MINAYTFWDRVEEKLDNKIYINNEENGK